MDLLCSVNWIALLVLAITLLLFKVLNQLAMKINWTFVVLISMVMGAVIGLVFASDNNSYLVWVDLIGDIYINVITALVAPVILISIMSGFISLNSKEKMKRTYFCTLASGFICSSNCSVIYFWSHYRTRKRGRGCIC